jgi:hypothetical protein
VFISYVASRAIYLDPSGELNLALTTLNDVSLTAPASGESLKYNGSSWVNGVVAGYTTEEAQDAVGGILTDTSSISFSYNDGAPSIAASVRSSGITDVMISGGVDALKIGSGSVSSTEFGYLDGVTSSLQVQLDSKYASANPSGYLTASVASATYQPFSPRLTTIVDMDAINFGLMQFRSGQLQARSIAQIKYDLGLDGYNTGDQDLSAYATTSAVAATYAVIAAGQPTSGTIGQVLAKNSGANYDSSWTSLVLGDRYLSTSTTSNAVSNGTKTFTIGTGLAYTPTQNITIAYDAAHHMHGQVTTYNSGTGVLVVDVNNHTGTGTYTSWVVNVGGVTPATVVSWGDIIGTLGTQSDLSDALNAKLEITTAASTYLPLAGGTMTGDLTFASGRKIVGTEASLWLSSGGGGQLAGYVSTTPVFSASVPDGFRVSNSLSIGWANFGTGLDAVPDLRLFRDGAGILAQRNSTNAQTLRVYNTYTSSTSFENLQFKAVAASAYQIGSAVGSAGGTNRAIEIGHYSSGGTFTSALSIATSGAVTLGANALTCGAITASGDVSMTRIQYASQLYLGIGATNYQAFSVEGIRVRGGCSFGFVAPGSGIGSTADTWIVQNSVGSIGLKTTASADAALTCGAITASGAITNSYTSLVSSPAEILTGTWFTGGTGTTTKPHLLIEPTGTTSTAWSTSGTAIGVNAAIGFAGNLIDTKVNNITKFSVSSGGKLYLASRYGTAGSTNGGFIGFGQSGGMYASFGNGGGAWYFGGSDLNYYTGIAPSSSGFGGAGITFGATVIDSATTTISAATLGIGRNSSGNIEINNGTAGSFHDLYLRSLFASGTILTRNGTSPTSIQITNTYTSATSYERINVRGVASANFEIGPENGSAGGTLRGLTLGGYTAGSATITPWLSFTNAGAATFAGAITASNLSGTNTGDQDLSSYATTSSVAAGYVSLSGTNTITGLKTFRSDGAPLSQTFQCYNPSTVNGVQILNYKARGSLATPLYPAANDIILGHYCYGHDENAGAFSGVKASYICSIPDAWTATSNSTQWTWVTTDTLDATKTAANRMRLQSDGSLTVGGITQSGGLLELVKSNTGLTGFGAALNRMRFSDSDTTTAANQPIGEIEFYSYDATAGAGVKGSFLCIAESATPAAAFVWGLDATTGVVSEVMRLSSVGLLTVVGGIKSTKGIYFTSEPTGTPSGTTQTLTLADSNHQTLALTSATGTVTATLTVPSGSSSGTIIVKQHASAAKDITWAVSAGTIKWMGTEPDWGSDAVSSVRLVSWRWDGSVMYLASTDVGT